MPFRIGRFAATASVARRRTTLTSRYSGSLRTARAEDLRSDLGHDINRLVNSDILYFGGRAEIHFFFIHFFAASNITVISELWGVDFDSFCYFDISTDLRGLIITFNRNIS